MLELLSLRPAGKKKRRRRRGEMSVERKKMGGERGRKKDGSIGEGRRRRRHWPLPFFSVKTSKWQKETRPAQDCCLLQQASDTFLLKTVLCNHGI